MNNFYVLKPEGMMFGTKWAYGEIAKPDYTGDADQCPVCGAAVSMLRWLPPHRLKLSSAQPHKWGDFLWGAGFPLMVSNRFKMAYETTGLTGITHFYPPAEIVRVGKQKAGDLPRNLPEYSLVDILWNGANLDDARSGALRKRMTCDFHRNAVEAIEHIVLEPGSWTGADVFEARGLPGRILVSERFKDMVESYNLKNVRLIPADKYAYDVHRPGGWYIRE